MRETTLTETPTSALQAQRLRVAAAQLSHLKLTANGEPYTGPDAITEDTVLGLRLGIAARTEPAAGGGFLYPIALTTPDVKSPDADAWRDAVDRAHLSRLVDHLAEGWTEQLPDLRRRHLLALQCSDDAAFQAVILSLAARSATLGGKTIVEIAYGKSVPIHPSFTSKGARIEIASQPVGELTPISVAELTGVGAALDDLSESRDQRAKAVFDPRAHDTQTAELRDTFNRSATAEDTLRILDDSGWTVAHTGADVTTLTREGVEGRLIRESRTLVVGDLLIDDEARTFRPLDLLVNANDPQMATPEAVVAHLVAEGHLAVRAEVHTARGSRVEIDREQNTTALAEAFADAIRVARSSRDASMPLAFAKTVEGTFEDVVTVEMSGRLRRWSRRDAQGLMLAAAQLVTTRATKTGDTTHVEHSIPPSVVDLTMTALETPGALAPVEYIASEPIITRDGKRVNKPGYDRVAKAYLAIPHRDRSRWARDYHVDETPTREQAQAAYEWLRDELLVDFSYASVGDRARHLAYLLTAACRNTITGAPGFLANAADRGSGKSLALLIGRIISQGHASSVGFRVGRYADDEVGKLLTSLLRTGQRFFHCDEVARGDAISGLTITELLTSIDGEREHRVLGTHEMVRQGGVVCSFAGNLVEPGADMNRRIFQIRLATTGGLSPVARTGFRHPDLVGWILENRPQLLAAVHTIMLHGLQQGPAYAVPGLGFSHNWAARIIGALTHLSDEDGVDLGTAALDGWLEEVAETDELGEQWGPLLAHLWARCHERPTTIAQMRETIDPQRTDVRIDLPSDLYVPAESEAAINRKWANAIKTIRGTTIPHEDGANYRITPEERVGASKKSMRYTIRAFDAKTGKQLIAGRPVAEQVTGREIEASDG